MIDSMEVITEINEEEFSKCFKNLNKYAKDNGVNLYKDKKVSNSWSTEYVTQAGKKKGFRKISLNKIRLTQKDNSSYTRCYVKLILQPILMISNHNYYDVFNSNQIMEIAKEFDKHIEKIFGKDAFLSSFFYWHPKRIDYAICIELDDRSTLENYIKLFQRADVPAGFQEAYIEERHRRGQREGSFYLINKGYVHINFYDKFDQIVKRSIKNNKTLVIEKRNVIRFEIQCSPSKVDNIKTSLGVKKKHLLHFLNPNICKRLLLHYYKNTIGFGDYYTYNRAIELIERIKFNQKIEEEMFNIIKLVRQKRSIYAAKQEYIGSDVRKKKRFIYLINKLNTNGINPVTLPDSWAIPKEFLQNPMVEIQNCFTGCDDFTPIEEITTTIFPSIYESNFDDATIRECFNYK